MVYQSSLLGIGRALPLSRQKLQYGRGGPCSSSESSDAKKSEPGSNRGTVGKWVGTQPEGGKSKVGQPTPLGGD